MTHVWKYDDGDYEFRVYGGNGIRVSVTDVFEHSVEIPREKALELLEWLKVNMRRGDVG